MLLKGGGGGGEGGVATPSVPPLDSPLLRLYKILYLYFTCHFCIKRDRLVFKKFILESNTVTQIYPHLLRNNYHKLIELKLNCPKIIIDVSVYIFHTSGDKPCLDYEAQKEMIFILYLNPCQYQNLPCHKLSL